MTLCTLVAKNKYVSENYDEATLFHKCIKCYLECSNKDSICSITCIVTFKMLVANGVLFNCKIFGIPNHNVSHVKPRQLSGLHRKQLAIDNTKTPSETHYQLLSENKRLSDVYSAQVIRKARSEVMCLERGSNDYISELMCQKQNLAPSFIRSISLDPFFVLMWSDSMLECYCSRVKRDGRISLYIDATANVVCPVSGKQIFANSIVIEPCKKGLSQIAVGMMLTSAHDQATYLYFFRLWWSAVLKKGTVSHPYSIVIDQNWPTIHGVMLIFNSLSILSYLKKCMEIVNGLIPSDDLKEFVIIGFGRSHIIKNIVHWKCYNGDKNINHWWKVSICHILTFNHWFIAQVYLKHLFKVLLSDNIDDCQDSINYINEVISSQNAVNDFVDFESVDCDTSSDSISKTIYSQSPFYKFFFTIFYICHI